MNEIVVTCAAIFAVILCAEIGWRQGWLKGEPARKFVHIIVGSFVAFWPWFLDWDQIVGLSVAFIVVISISRYLHVFRAIHSVHRPTWGELFFAVIVGLLALTTSDDWVYMAALLHMSLADGLAAIIGVHLGRTTRYSIVGHVKSFVGTGTFFLVSVGILLVYSVGSGVVLNLGEILGIAIVATVLENISTRGFDNLSVPLWVALALSHLT